jgi:glyoxalase family protein
MGTGGPHAELHVAVQPGCPSRNSGAGGVHHVAFRTPDEEQYHAWTERLNSMGIRNSGEIDRYYFRSLYFREPNGILFEIATDGPGSPSMKTPLRWAKALFAAFPRTTTRANCGEFETY